MDTAPVGGHPLGIEHRSEDLRPYGRRTFLAVVGAGITSLLWGPKVWGFTRDALLPVSAVLPPPLRGLVRDGWRIYTVAVDAAFRPDDVEAAGRGLVEQPIELDYSQLAPFRGRGRPPTSTVSRAGRSWRALVGRADRRRPRGEADAQAPGARLLSGDGAYPDSLTLEQAHLADAMLADRMDGLPLTRPHGSPLRLVVPEMYGYKGVKWVNRIELVERRSTASGSSAATTATPGSGGRMATELWVRRFSRTERAVHWIHATAFFALLASGLILYLPALAVGRQPAAREGRAHRRRRSPGPSRWRSSSCSATGRGLRQTRASSTSSTPTTGSGSRRIPVAQGRFNAGQKLNAASPPRSPSSSGSPVCCSGRASGTRASASPARSSSTTR